MKPKDFNPSPLEVAFAKSIVALKDRIQENIGGIKIDKVIEDTDADNPALRFYVTDKEGDKHEIVIRVIQRANGMF